MCNITQTIDSQIRSRIYGHGRGWVFTPKHFQSLGGSAAIDSCLRRLKASDTIRQLARGLYDYPVKDPDLGTVAPSADAIARALVARDAIRIQTSGAYAANVLGLSEQVPSRIVFLNYSWVDYTTHKPGTFRLTPPAEHLSDWKSDYADMLGPMFFGETPTFEEMIITATDFETRINKSK